MGPRVEYEGGFCYLGSARVQCTSARCSLDLILGEGTADLQSALLRLLTVLAFPSVDRVNYLDWLAHRGNFLDRRSCRLPRLVRESR